MTQNDTNGSDASTGQFSAHELLDVPFYGFWLLDSRGRTEFANRELVSWLGVPEILGRPATEFLSPERRAEFDRRLTMLPLGVSEEFDAELIGDEGETFPVRITLSPRFDAEGKHSGATAVVRDLRADSDHQVDVPLPERGQLTQYLTAGVAHSLNTALQSVLGYAGLLSESGGVREDLTGPMRSLYDSAAEASRLVSHLVSLADVGDGNPAGVEPIGMFAAVVDSRRPYLEANNVEVVLPTPEADTLVWADPVRVRRAMSHVVANACRVALAHGGGTVSLDVTTTTADVVLTVSATGPGFPDEVLAFEAGDYTPNLPPIVMAHAMAMGLIEDVGGRLHARNQPTGAEIIVVLPGASPEVVESYRSRASPAAPFRVAQTASLAGRKVLVVDDEPTIRDLSIRALQEVCDVTAVESADEAWQELREGNFDLVVTDLRMPGALDGMGLYRWALEERPGLASRFVFTTADTASRSAMDFLMMAGRPFLQKPFDIRNYRMFVQDELSRKKP